MDVPIGFEAARLNAPIPPFSEMVLEPKQKLCAVFIIVIVKFSRKYSFCYNPNCKNCFKCMTCQGNGWIYTTRMVDPKKLARDLEIPMAGR